MLEDPVGRVAEYLPHSFPCYGSLPDFSAPYLNLTSFPRFRYFSMECVS